MKDESEKTEMPTETRRAASATEPAHDWIMWQLVDR
jgi:hypothetical protein